MSLVERVCEKLSCDAVNELSSLEPTAFIETLSPRLFLAMAPNFSNAEFVKQAARIFFGRELRPSEYYYFHSELTSLRVSRNELLSIFRYSEEGKAHSRYSSFSLYFWRYYRFALKVCHRVPKVGPFLCRVIELPKLLLVISSLPRRLEELESEISSLKREQRQMRTPK